MNDESSSSTSAALRWFILRVLAVTAVLAIPILGTSYALVSSVTADIAMAAKEHAELAAFATVIDIVPRLEAVHDDLADRRTATIGRDVAAVDAAADIAAATYANAVEIPAAHAVWQHWRAVWSRAEQHPDLAGIARALDALQDIGSEVDDDSPLEFDPSFAVQNLVATTLRQNPRSVVAIRHTADIASVAGDPALDAAAIVRVSTARALQREPLARLFADLPAAVALSPRLGPLINPSIAPAKAATAAFGARIDSMLHNFRREPSDRVAIAALARAAIDAQITLWRAGRAAADEVIVARYSAQVDRRRITVALALLAVLLGVIAITLVGRHMARRDRIELASAKLEGDKLRAELVTITTERALRLQEAQFRSVFENADLGIVIFELNGAIAQYNGAVSSMLGDRMQAIVGNRLAEISSFTDDRDSFTLEELHLREDGVVQWLALTFSGVYDDGRCQLVILLLRDTTEEKLLQAGLMHAASHDSLTQIANRSAFEQQLESLMSNEADPFALMYVDLDTFKPVNDRYGHAAGDHVLVTTAQRMRSALAIHDFCARLGGDEFAVLLRGDLTEAMLTSIAARVGAALAEPIAFGDSELRVTASVGIVRRMPQHHTGGELKIAADRALYRAKGSGGNTGCIDAGQPAHA